MSPEESLRPESSLPPGEAASFVVTLINPRREHNWLAVTDVRCSRSRLGLLGSADAD